MRFAWKLLTCLMMALVAAGCVRGTASTDDEGPKGEVPVATPAHADANKPAAEWTANEILKRLLATYRQAKTYRDQAIVRLAFRQNGQSLSQEQPIAVSFERPDKLAISAFQATVKSDGKEFRARIEDAASNNVDGQVVVRPAPQPLKLADLAKDELLYETISSRLRRQPVQLELLLEAGGLVAAFDADVACRRLGDKEHGGKTCFLVAVPSPGGEFVFWVDQSDFLLRRLDYPTAALVPDLANDTSVSQLELFADLRGANINQPIAAGEFVLAVPPNAKQMKAFTRPPPPLPTDLFGQQPADFFFTRLDGKQLKANDLVGKAVVLAWYHDNPACEATLQQVSAAAQRLAKDDAVSFYAVATDPLSLTNTEISRRLAQWKVDLPVIRDLEAFGDKAFRIELQPTTVVLDKRGCVQIFQTGGSPEFAEQLVAIVERLKRGDDLAGEIVAEYRREREKYEQLLSRGGPEPGELVEVPEAVIRRRSEPQKYRIQPLWKCDLEQAGNILVSTAPQASRIFALSGGRNVIEIGSDGKVVARHVLELPEQVFVTFGRLMNGDAGGRLFVGSSPMAPQFLVFDEQGKLRLRYPQPDQAPLGVADLAVADLDGDNHAEIVAAAMGGAGIVAITAQGEVRWRNNKIPAVLSLAVCTPDDGGSLAIFAAGDEKGAIARLNRFGNEETPATVANWSIVRIFGSSLSGNQQANLLGLGTNLKNEPFAVGLTQELTEKWNYPLPPGVHQNPIEPIVASHMLSGYRGEWWIAGPDGSVHLITANGQLFDSFFTGSPLTGIAAVKIDDKPVLLLSNNEGVTAWQIEVPAATSRARER